MTPIHPRRVAALLAVCLLAVTSACSPTKDSSDDAASDDTAAPAAGACTPEGDETPAKALLRCGEHSVVYLETPYASGTGIIVEQDDEQYVLTNLHVVDPFAGASVRFADGEELAANLPVLGAQAATDIALLGPIGDVGDVELEPVPLDETAVDKGDDVFIVGYPGTLVAPEDLDLTITSGLVSRRRELPEWDQTYVQTDAVVEEGQSGGPMFTATGELAGITALGFDESFSLALESADVAASAEQIVAGDGDTLPLVPTSADDDAPGGATSGTIEMPDDLEVPTYFLPPSAEDRTWNLSVSGPGAQYGVAVYDALSGEPLAESAAGVALSERLIAAEAAAAGVTVEQYVGPAEPLDPEVVATEVAPGTFRIEVPAETAAEVQVMVAPDAVPATLQWTSDLELWPLTTPVEVGALELGEPAETVLGGYQFAAPYEIELTEGDTLRLLASSPQGFVDLVVAEPGAVVTSSTLNVAEDLPGVTFFAESGGGLYGVDVDETYTAPVTGTYRVLLENLDAYTVAARVEVRVDDGTSDDEGGDQPADEEAGSAEKS